MKLSPVERHALGPPDHVPINVRFPFERTMDAAIRKLLPTITSPELLKIEHKFRGSPKSAVSDEEASTAFAELPIVYTTMVGSHAPANGTIGHAEGTSSV